MKYANFYFLNIIKAFILNKFLTHLSKLKMLVTSLLGKNLFLPISKSYSENFDQLFNIFNIVFYGCSLIH